MIKYTIRRMSKYRIKFYSDFCDSLHCKNVCEEICQVDLLDNYGPDKEIYITTDDDYTHVITWNTAMPDGIKVPKKNVIGLAFEPLINLKNVKFENCQFMDFVTHVENNFSKYFIGSNEGLPSNVFIQDYSFMPHIAPPRIEFQKKNIMSIMISQKIYAMGHMYRHMLVDAILQTNLPIDIYGRGCVYHSEDVRLKGEFSDKEPYESYDFHICIENNQTPAYVSEKYLNAILFGTTPIYWGATMIESFFPNVTISLSGDLEKDMDLLFDIVSDPMKYKKSISQEEMRPKMNLLKNLDKIFEK